MNHKILGCPKLIPWNFRKIGITGIEHGTPKAISNEENIFQIHFWGCMLDMSGVSIFQWNSGKSSFMLSCCCLRCFRYSLDWTFTESATISEEQQGFERVTSYSFATPCTSAEKHFGCQSSSCFFATYFESWNPWATHFVFCWGGDIRWSILSMWGCDAWDTHHFPLMGGKCESREFFENRAQKNSFLSLNINGNSRIPVNIPLHSPETKAKNIW